MPKGGIVYITEQQMQQVTEELTKQGYDVRNLSPEKMPKEFFGLNLEGRIGLKFSKLEVGVSN